MSLQLIKLGFRGLALSGEQNLQTQSTFKLQIIFVHLFPTIQVPLLLKKLTGQKLVGGIAASLLQLVLSLQLILAVSLLYHSF